MSTLKEKLSLQTVFSNTQPELFLYLYLYRKEKKNDYK